MSAIDVRRRETEMRASPPTHNYQKSLVKVQEYDRTASLYAYVPCRVRIRGASGLLALLCGCGG